jgi:hypothetical protein
MVRWAADWQSIAAMAAELRHKFDQQIERQHARGSSLTPST